MLILGIDTATDILALSLLDEDKIIAEYNLSLKRQHSEKLLPLMQEMFDTLDIRPEELDGVAVGTGPGSFTGLRIAITAAKMMGRIFSIPVKGISTLETIAGGLRAEYVLPLIDARRKRVYYSFYKGSLNAKDDSVNNSDSLKKILDAAGAEMESLPEILAEYKDKKIMLAGHKTEESCQILKKAGYDVAAAESENNYPRAAVLARLGRNYIKEGKEDSIYELKPTYLKKPQAELNWQKKYYNS